MMRRALFPLLSSMAAVLCSCSSNSGAPAVFQTSQPDIVFALGSREGFVSPLNASLKPACPALEFRGTSYALTGAHRRTLAQLAKGWSEAGKPKYVLAGYTPPEMTEDYARALSERRALAVRQALIEQGIEAASLQTVGFGQDSAPSGPTTGVVVIYKQ